jgi:hypothetical protein
MASAEERERRVKRAGELLRRRVRTEDVITVLIEEFEVSRATAKRLIRSRRASWAKESTELERSDERELAIREAQDWIRRLTITDRTHGSYLPMAAAKRSSQVLNWQARLLDLRGVSFRKVEIEQSSIPISVHLSVPPWDDPPEGAAGESDEG